MVEQNPDTAVAEFVSALSARVPSDNVFNPWRDTCPIMDDPTICPRAPALRSARLAEHLTCYPGLVLIGEAPGYRGCRYSGVPFTSERLIVEGLIPRVPRMSRFTTHKRPWSEPSATIVWNVLRDLRIHETTVMWNAFPFHPHRPDEPHTNRTPSPAELIEGEYWLKRFLALPNIRSAEVLPVGKKAAELLSSIGKGNPAIRLRHPANGGARKFAEGLAAYARKAEDRRFEQPHFGH